MCWQLKHLRTSEMRVPFPKTQDQWALWDIPGLVSSFHLVSHRPEHQQHARTCSESSFRRSAHTSPADAAPLRPKGLRDPPSFACLLLPLLLMRQRQQPRTKTFIISVVRLAYRLGNYEFFINNHFSSKLQDLTIKKIKCNISISCEGFR